MALEKGQHKNNMNINSPLLNWQSDRFQLSETEMYNDCIKYDIFLKTPSKASIVSYVWKCTTQFKASDLIVLQRAFV